MRAVSSWGFHVPPPHVLLARTLEGTPWGQPTIIRASSNVDSRRHWRRRIGTRLPAEAAGPATRLDCRRLSVVRAIVFYRANKSQDLRRFRVKLNASGGFPVRRPHPAFCVLNGGLPSDGPYGWPSPSLYTLSSSWPGRPQIKPNVNNHDKPFYLATIVGAGDAGIPGFRNIAIHLGVLLSSRPQNTMPRLYKDLQRHAVRMVLRTP